MTDDDVYTTGNYFETRFPYDDSKNIVWKEIANYLDSRYGINGTVVDVGSGYGYFLNSVNADKTIAIDHSDYPLKKTNNMINSIVGDVTSLPIPDNTANTLMASNVLEHLEIDDIQKALSEFRRVLTGDGTLFIVTPNFALNPQEYFDDFTHKSILTHRSLEDLLELTGFRVEDSIIRFLPFSSESNFPIRSWLVRLYLMLPRSPFAGQSLFVATRDDH